MANGKGLIFPGQAAPQPPQVLYDIPHHLIECVITIRCRCSRPEPILLVRTLYQVVQCPICRAHYRVATVKFEMLAYVEQQRAAGVPDDQIDFNKVPTQIQINRVDPAIVSPLS